MTYCFDIDGTVCTITDGRYDEAKPYPEIIGEINRLYDAGHRIVFHTARGSQTRIDWQSVTERQLKDWNVKYHELVFGKPSADLYIDDKGINVHRWIKKTSIRDGGPEKIG
jgi:hypothetical protein